jgi:NhaP-type Na+/H+ or K+/H+ antiporter
MKFSEKSIMSFAGSIRGAIAFGLAISIDSKNQKIKQVLVSSTLVLVFITTILFGGLMPFIIRFFKGFEPIKEEDEFLLNHDYDKEEDENHKFVDFTHPNFKKRT